MAQATTPPSGGAARAAAARGGDGTLEKHRLLLPRGAGGFIEQRATARGHLAK